MEWIVVTVIIALVGLITAIVSPIAKLTATVTRLVTQMESFVKGLEDFKGRYIGQIDEFKDVHNDLYERVDNHEHRITKLETKHEKE